VTCLLKVGDLISSDRFLINMSPCPVVMVEDGCSHPYCLGHFWLNETGTSKWHFIGSDFTKVESPITLEEAALAMPLPPIEDVIEFMRRKP
jgi:hypothetical protein